MGSESDLDILASRNDLLIMRYSDHLHVDHNYSLSLATVPMDISHEVEVDDGNDPFEENSQEEEVVKIFSRDPKSVSTQTSTSNFQPQNDNKDANNNKTSSSQLNLADNNRNDDDTVTTTTTTEIVVSAPLKKNKKRRRLTPKKKKLRVPKVESRRHESSSTRVKRKKKAKLDDLDPVSRAIENIIDRTIKKGQPSTKTPMMMSGYKKICACRLLENGRLLCLLCDKSFKNKNVLYNHRSVYHREDVGDHNMTPKTKTEK